MTPPQFSPEWTTPPPPRAAGGPGASRAPMRPRRIWAGVGLALLGHLVTIGVPALIALVGVGGGLWTWVALLGQFALFVTCVTVGIVLIVRGERGIGLGLLIGWGVGVVAIPVIGFVIWVYVVSRTGFG